MDMQQAAMNVIFLCADMKIMFSMGLFYINRLIEKGPAGAEADPSADEGAAPSRPISAASSATREAIRTGD